MTKTPLPETLAGDEGHGFRPGIVVADRYELVALLRVSHLGARWSAWDHQLDRRVTIKLVAPQALSDPVAGEWFRRESLATARIHHPNVLELYDAHNTHGSVFLVLEDVEGPSLDDVGCGPFAPELVAALGQQVATGLAAAHTLDVVHRDIRPANLLIADSGHVKIANFTLAKLLDGSGQAVTVEKPLRDRFGYVAPEQLTEAPVGAPADIYALGLIMWEALNGHLPWHETDPLPTGALKRLHEPLPPASTGTGRTEAQLSAIIDRATQRDANERHRSAAMLADALHEICGTRPEETVRTHLLPP